MPACTLLSGLMFKGAPWDLKLESTVRNYSPSPETTFDSVDVDDITLYDGNLNRTVQIRILEKWCQPSFSADTEQPPSAHHGYPDEKERGDRHGKRSGCRSATITVTQAARTPEPFSHSLHKEFPEVGSAGEKLSATITTNQPGGSGRVQRKWCKKPPITSAEKPPHADRLRQLRRTTHHQR